MNRYDVSSREGEYAKDSAEQVLANKLGISTTDDIDGAELVLLEKLYRSVFEEQFRSVFEEQFPLVHISYSCRIEYRLSTDNLLG